MTHRLLSLFVLVAVLAPDASAQFGVSFGANFDRISDVRGTREATFNNASGYHIGVHVDLPVGPIALRPGIIYTDLGSIEGRESGVVDAVRNFNISLVEIPIDVRYRILLPLAKPYLHAGPVLRFANQSDDDVSVRDFTLAGNLGAGLELTLAGVRPFLEARYQFGLQRFLDGFETPVGTVGTESDAKLNTFMIRAGITF